MPEDHQITIDGRRWLLRFTRLRGDAMGWTFFDNATSPGQPNGPMPAHLPDIRRLRRDARGRGAGARRESHPIFRRWLREDEGRRWPAILAGARGFGAIATATVITTPGPNYGDVTITVTNGGSDYTYAYIQIDGYNQYGWDCGGGSSYGDAVITDGVITGYSSSGWFSPFIRTCSVPEGDVLVEAPTVIITGTGYGVEANAIVDDDPNSSDFGKVTSVIVNSPGQNFETGLFSYLSISIGQLRLKANWEQNCNLPVEGLPCQQPTGVYTTTDPCAVSLFKQYDLVWGSRYSVNMGAAPDPVECPNASSCHWSTYYTTATAAYPDTGMGQMTANIEIA